MIVLAAIYSTLPTKILDPNPCSQLFFGIINPFFLNFFSVPAAPKSSDSDSDTLPDDTFQNYDDFYYYDNDEEHHEKKAQSRNKRDVQARNKREARPARAVHYCEKKTKCPTRRSERVDTPPHAYRQTI